MCMNVYVCRMEVNWRKWKKVNWSNGEQKNTKQHSQNQKQISQKVVERYGFFVVIVWRPATKIDVNESKAQHSISVA